MTGIAEPPLALASKVGGDLSIGRWHVAQLKRYSVLRPDERVLDIGCGIGRTARWLVPELRRGSYEGFDICRESIEWCQSEITTRHPSFRFTHVDLMNAAYNPAGTLRADEFRFPYDDGEFDLACLFSVFTHLMPDDFRHYLSEIRRVLKPSGRMQATFFLLSPERFNRLRGSEHPIAASLMSGNGPTRTGYDSADEWLVAYEEDYARREIAEHGFELGLIDFGLWPTWAVGEEEQMGPQDTVVAGS